MSPRLREERGFVLSMVIFAVAALSIAGTALYLVVQSENAMANAGAESSVALHLANAGLARYAGETFGRPRASVSYEMGGGTVDVTASKVMSLGDTADIYIIRSEAQIPDRRVPDLVARRTVRQFALLRRRPFNPVAALAVASSGVRTRDEVVIDGEDACGTAPSVSGIATLGARERDLDGSISDHTTFESREEMVAAIDADWDLLTDPRTPFDYENTIPGGLWSLFGSPDTFTTIRYDRDVTIGGFFPPSGRGLIVVDGTLTVDSRYFPWHWEGVIMAGAIEIRNNSRLQVDGALLTGFEDEESLGGPPLRNVQIRYNSCNVLAASQGISTFSPIANTWWESAD